MLHSGVTRSAHEGPLLVPSNLSSSTTAAILLANLVRRVRGIGVSVFLSLVLAEILLTLQNHLERVSEGNMRYRRVWGGARMCYEL